MQQHTIQIFMWAWYPESAKIHQKVSGGFWRIQDMSNIYTGGFWWIHDTSILCVTKLVDFGGFRILSSKNTQGVRVNVHVHICRNKHETVMCVWVTLSADVHVLKLGQYQFYSSTIFRQTYTYRPLMICYGITIIFFHSCMIASEPINHRYVPLYNKHHNKLQIRLNNVYVLLN